MDIAAKNMGAECKVEEILAREAAKDEERRKWFPSYKDYFRERQIYSAHWRGECNCGKKTKMEQFYEAMKKLESS